MQSPRLSREQSRALDRRAIDEYGMSGLVLMENAGRGCVDVLERLGIAGTIAIVCGKGNNAGDGFVIARHLEVRGHTCHVLLLSDPNELRGDAAANFAILQKTNVPIIPVAAQGPPPERAGSSPPPAHLLSTHLTHHTASTTWIIDALLGTGAQGNPRPPFDMAIEWINSHPPTTKVLAVDVPSGLDCDTGRPAKPTVRADYTCTFAATKIGYLQPTAKEFTGVTHVCDIGVPASLLHSIVREVPG
jgi:NAD(P)H-hydrate epimerase